VEGLQKENRAHNALCASVSPNPAKIYSFLIEFKNCRPPKIKYKIFAGFDCRQQASLFGATRSAAVRIQHQGFAENRFGFRSAFGAKFNNTNSFSPPQAAKTGLPNFAARHIL